VLDNFEHVLAARTDVAALLAATDRPSFLVTSRVPLGIAGEVVVRVEPLARPAATTDIERSPASALFLRRARERGALAVVEPAEAAAIVEICARLDGLPLALELVAAWSRILLPRAIVRRLADGRLTVGGGADPRQVSLEAVVRSTVALVGDRARDVLRAIAVFAGPFDEPGVRAVTGDEDAIAALRELEAVGLVDVRSADDGEPEFRLLETIRAIAAVDLPEAGLVAVHERRHAEMYAERAAAAADVVRTSSYSEQRGGAALADPNLIVALERAMALRDGDLAVQLAASLATRAMQTGILREAAIRLEASLALPVSDPGIRADGLNALVSVRGALGADVDLADAREAVELATRSGSGIRVVRTLITLGNWSDEGRALHYADAARLAEEIGYGWGAAIAWSSLSAVWWDEGRHADALDASARAERAHEQRGDLTGVALEVMTRGTYALVLGDIVGALELLTRAVDAFARKPGVPMFDTNALSALATAQALAGRTADAYATLARGADRASVAESPYEVPSWLEAAAVVLEPAHPALAARCLGAVDRAVSEDRLGVLNEPITGALGARLERRIGLRQVARERAAGRALGRTELFDHLLPLVRREAGPPEGAIAGPFGALTSREHEILALLADGRTDREIGAQLGISPKTASVHVANVKSKLGVETRVAAVLAARERLGPSATTAAGQAAGLATEGRGPG
ncbi:MAG: hypothetical protein QOF49_413, partial [Chloroflexota bacterium]|nr:hypothetical protein [Chloroflexota bacterium]